MFKELEELNERIISCKKCPRLASYIKELAKNKPKRYKNWNYWAKPIPGFGDINAKLLIIGLAPAAHGGNRTGRMFTGDGSGEWLVKALYELGFANQPVSISRDDGLLLKDVYITASLRCAPPKNKPNRDELKNCRMYLREELSLLKNVKVVITLGRIAFENFLSIMRGKGYKIKLEFKHGENYRIGNYILIASYHPSRQNTQTGKLKWEEWLKVFKMAKENFLL